VDNKQKSIDLMELIESCNQNYVVAQWMWLKR